MTIRANVYKDHIRIDSKWQDKELIKTIPGSAWKTKEGYWSLPLSWASCKALRGVFGNRLVLGVALKQWAKDDIHLRQEPMNAVREALDYPKLTDRGNSHDDLLYPFQRAGREFLVTAGDALLSDQMGTGKTLQTLSAIRELDMQGFDPYPVLVVAPNSVKANWEKEVNHWLPEANPYVVKGNITQKRKVIAAAKEADKAIVIVNIESMRTLSRLSAYGSIRLKQCSECDPSSIYTDMKVNTCETHKKELNTFGFKTAVLDEAHRVKDMKSKQARAVKATFHGDTITRRWALTGTPVANHPGDLWSIMHITAPKDFPQRSKFIDRYANTQFNVFGGMDIVGLKESTKEEFFSFFDPRFRRMLKEMVLDQLPSKVRTIRNVEMGRDQKKAYQDMEAKLVAEVEGGNLLMAPNSLVGALRLIQLASAQCRIETNDSEKVEDWDVFPTGTSPKIEEALELITSEPERPIVVAAEHSKLIDLTSQLLHDAGVKHVLITGRISEQERAKNLADFQEGRVNVLLFTYKAGGVGLNMTRADTMIRLQRSWSLIDNQQGEDRIHRIGSEQHDSVNIIDLVTEGTIEEKQVLRLHEKLERLEEITRDKEQLKRAGKDTSELEKEEAEMTKNDFLGSDV